MTAPTHGEPPPQRGGAYTYVGTVRWEYAPDVDKEPDPGEIVWAWVAFEENASIGKDRPIAIIGRADDGRLAALMLSSRDHQGERGWIPIGSGPWDRDGRPSWLRRDRLLAVSADAVRREGAVIPPTTFARVVEAVGGPSPRRRGLLARLFGRR